MKGIIRVLIADDSPTARMLLRGMLEGDPAFEVVGEAENGARAVTLAASLGPDLITMDLEMPSMTGMEAITEIMATRPVPILVVSSFADAHNAYAAISRGAVDVIAKPDASDREVARFLDKAKLVASIRVITHLRRSQAGPMPWSVAGSPAAGAGRAPLPPVFAIASSTGGTQALAQILGALPSGFACPILVAQHVVPGFAAGLASWLSTLSPLPVRLGRHGELVSGGTVHLAPSEVHMGVTSTGSIAFTEISDSDIYRPSCNRLLDSVAACFGRRTVGVILSGMGSDGAEGMRRIKAAGGRTIAQDEASSVVYGMNQCAVKAGSVDTVLPVAEIATEMIRLSGQAPVKGSTRP